ncbi:MAG: hypothetical protein KAV00_02035 [Phycisphaerae bacterium]|nr:hypothetical protein [Phycisphaerae bacterium]
MASTHTFTGGTSTDYGLAANYDNATAPATGDTILWNEQASQGSLVDMDADSNGHTYPKIIVAKGYVKGFAAAGDKFNPTMITNLSWGSAFPGTSYIDAPIEDGTVECPSNAGTLQLSGIANHLSVNGGKVHFDANSTIHSDAGDGLFMSQTRGVPTEVKIDNGATLAGSRIEVDGGQLATTATVITLICNGGVVFLRGAAAATLVIVSNGGVVHWDSTGTVSMVYANSGGVFQSKQYTRHTKTLTEGHMFGDGLIDLSCEGGNIITLTNGIWTHGTRQPIFPAGSLVTAS